VAIEIVMPRLSDSMEEGTITQWLVTAGDAVKPGDPLVEVETDKATVTYECEHAGTILLLAATEGESVAVGAVIAAVGEPGETVETVSPAAAADTVESREAVPIEHAVAVASSQSGSRTGAGGRVKASPLARRIAIELGVDLTAVLGTGPRGRVVKADVELNAGRSHGNGAVGASAGDSLGAKGSSTVRELSRMQQTVARRMAQSRSTVPDFELRREFDMSAVVAMREQLGALTDPAPSYNDFMIKACALALRDFPRVNGSYRDGAIEIFERINIGIAVAADDALVVPTIFDADRKSLAEIGQTSRELAAKVRDGSVTPAELSGGTFTVSNLGMFGLDSFTAVVNPPQAAILAIGSLKPRPVVAGDGLTIVARPTVHVSLACDHRILYGAEGARFLARLNELLEAPVSLLL
jgi:pyruvate dehydrogenase E2 component (dihydrolipoamide acetyltransferase)